MMVMAKKKKRTLSPEQIAKMQEGKRQAKLKRERITRLESKGFATSVPESFTERALNSVRYRKRK